MCDCLHLLCCVCYCCCFQEQKKAEDQKQGIWARLMKMLYKDLRAGPSGADPSSFVGTAVETEEDVLHVKELPTFGGVCRLYVFELLLLHAIRFFLCKLMLVSDTCGLVFFQANLVHKLLSF